MNVPTSYYGTKANARFREINSDLFSIEERVRALGFDDVRLALYRARIELGRAEEMYRREYAANAEGKDEGGLL